MVETDNLPRPLTGTVKWYDPGKGFGFILDDEGGDDVLLHGNVLRNFGQNSVVDGARVVATAIETPRGRQAVEIQTITPPEGSVKTSIKDLDEFDAARIAELPLHPARIKWFDKVKGFGFANVFGDPRDIFVHIEVLRVSGFVDVQPGEAVVLRHVEGRRGLMAAQILAWEAANHPEEDAAPAAPFMDQD